MKKFLIIDRNIIARFGIKLLLQRKFNRALIHEASDTEGIELSLTQNQYDMVIMEIQTPGTETIQLVQYINKNLPVTRVFIFSSYEENLYAQLFFNAGAMGYLCKTASIKEIEKAIDKMLNNVKYISVSLAQIFKNKKFELNSINLFGRLSERETEIASLLLAGQSVSYISLSKKIKPSTTCTYKSRLFDKLGITNLLQLKEVATLYNF